MTAFWAILARVLLRVRAGYWQIVYRGYSHRYRISPSFRFNGAAIQLYGEGSIDLGDESYVGELSTIQAGVGLSVRVGRRCRIAHNVRIYTESAAGDSNFLLGPDTSIRGDVFIGDGAWVGANVLINPGITVGRNAVVGANAVLTRTVPPDEIWGGVPARLIRPKERTIA